MKILITGAVEGGKVHAAKRSDVTNELPLKRTDDLIGKMDWSAESEEVAKWLDEPGDFILEGATVIRALRKWLAGHPTGKPCDKVILLTVSIGELSKGQVSSSKAQATMWGQIEAELKARGVEIEIKTTLPPLEAKP